MGRQGTRHRACCVGGGGVAQLALDGVELVGAVGLGDQVDAGVAGIEALPLGPIGIGPDIGIQVAIGGFVAQVDAGEVFEVGAFFALGRGCVAIGVQQVLQCAHASGFHRKEAAKSRPAFWHGGRGV